MRGKVIPYLVLAMAFAMSDFALARDLGGRSRGGQSLRSAPSMKVPRTRAVPRNNVPVYPGLTSPGIDRSTIGLEYNQRLREQINRIPPYVLIR
jgi:hypothetical protein